VTENCTFGFHRCCSGNSVLLLYSLSQEGPARLRESTAMTSSDVFLSYHRSDRNAVEQVRQFLNARGLSTFIDYRNLAAGLPWPRALEDALRSAKAVAVFVGPELGLWQTREMDFALDRQTEEERAGRNFPVIPVLLPGAAITSGFLFRNTWVDLREDPASADAINQLVDAIRGKDAAAAIDALALCPYQGLKAFREEHAAFFFGRDEIAGRLLERVLKETGFVAVMGPSGSGKSSVVLCGLIPLLRRQRPPSKAWDAVVCTPGDRPFHRLAHALIPLLEPEATEVDRLAEAQKLGDRLAAGDVELGSVADVVIEKSNGTDRLLIVIDQFEELFTLAPEKDRRSFANSVIAVSGRTRMEFAVTLRADYCGHLIALSREWSDRLERSTVNVGPMTRTELEQVIVKPAKKVGLDFEAGLADRLLDDVDDEPGNLPLLEFALTELWAQRQGRLMTHAAYENFGGLAQAISNRADAELSKLNPDGQAAVRRIFTRLVRVAAPGQGLEDSRQRVPLAELGSAARPFVDRLVEARLLVTARDDSSRETVEVSHEALIQRWGDLQSWLNEDREFLLWRQRLRLSCDQWQRLDRDEGVLLRGGLLSEAERWWRIRASDLNEQERDFIVASLQHRQKRLIEAEARKNEEERRRKRRARNLAGALLAVSILAAFSLVQRNRALSQGRIALARGLLSRAILITNTEPAKLDQAALLAIESLKLEPAAEAERIVRNAFALLPEQVNRPWQMDCSPETATFSSGGAFLACINHAAGRVEIMSSESGQKAASVPIPRLELIRQVQPSPDGHFLGIGLPAGFRLYNIQSRPAQIVAESPDAEAGAGVVVAFSPDSQYFASAVPGADSKRTTIQVMSTSGAGPWHPFPIESRALALTFSSDGKYLAALHEGETSAQVTVVDLGGKQSPQTIAGGAGIGTLAVSNGAAWIAVAELDAVRVTDRINRQPFRLSHEKRPHAVALTEDGFYVATAGDDGAARVIEATTDRLVALVPAGAPVKAVAFTDHDELVLASEDRTVRTVKVLQRPGFESWPVAVKGISPGGRYLTSFTSGSTPELSLVDRETAKTQPLSVVARQPVPLDAKDPGELADLVRDLFVSGVIRYSADETYVVATGGSYGLTAFDLKTKNSHYEPPKPGVVAAAVSGDGRTAAWATSKDIELFSTLDGIRRGTLQLAGARALELSSDGSLLAAFSGNTKSLVVLDTSSGKEVLRREMHSPATRVAFSPDARYIAALSQTGELVLADLQGSSPGWQRQVKGPLLIFSRDSKMLAAGGGRGSSVEVVATATGARVATLEVANEAAGAAFSPDAGYLEVADDTSLSRHYLSTADLIEQTCSMLPANLRHDQWETLMAGLPYRPTCRNR
jgi:WD40 repeat protein/energy-coupling factor transporter ATP-binding protein EcfA2